MIWKALSADKSFIYRNTEFENPKDNSPVEILKGVEEIYNRINAVGISESENVRQINFWKKYQKK